MANQFRIAIDLSGVTEGVYSLVDEAMFPRLNQAVRSVAQATLNKWADGVMKARGVWSEEKIAYVSSLKWSMTGPFAAVVETDYKYAEQIESGRPARDLKLMLNTSMKVRRTKDGRRFLVIPMRHNVPEASATGTPMPESIYMMASQLDASTVIGTGRRRSGEVTELSPKFGMRPAKRQTPFLSNPKTRRAATVTRAMYQYGDKLTKGDLKAAGASAAQVRRYAGLYRFETGSGAKQRSTYLTFRVMMEGKPGWVVPAKPGLNIARDTSLAMQSLAEAAFTKAMQLDVG